MNTRRDILAAVPRALLALAWLPVVIVWLVVTMPVVFGALLLVLLPVELLLIVSPIVGLIYPPAGRWCASWMEPGMELWAEGVTARVWEPPFIVLDRILP